MNTAKIDGQSLSTQEELLQLLQEQFPEVFSDGKVDAEKLKQSLGEKVSSGSERYGLSWAGKANCFREIQKTTSATLAPIPNESVDFDNTKNLFIEGDNLEVLRVLQRSYYGKVKMIYIDPPYNTGNDFIYDDNFKQDKTEYEELSGQKNGNGDLLKDNALRRNTRDNGHYHSDWLSMMYPRLFLARNLLRRDGVIFVSIDDNEVANLRLIMDEIFGEENFVAQFIWKSRQNKDNRNITGVSIDHEYIICYSKNYGLRSLRGEERKTEQYSNPDNDQRGPWTSANMVGLLSEDLRPNCHYDLVNPATGINYGKPRMGWRYERQTMQKLIEEGRIIWPEKTDGRPRRKVFLSELSEILPGYSSIIEKKIFTRDGTKEIEEIFDGKRLFDFPKPTALISELIKQTTLENDIVLDFFAGSGSTAHATLEATVSDGKSRKWISVQIAENTDERSEAYKEGYANIADVAKERIRRVGKKIVNEGTQPSLDNYGNSQLDIGFKVFRVQASNFDEWRGLIKNPNELSEQLQLSVDNIKPDSKQTNILTELILKSGLELTEPVKKSEQDGLQYFVVGDNKLVVCLDGTVTKEFIDFLEELKPNKVILLERVFANNDDLKTNAILNLERANIDFKVI